MVHPLDRSVASDLSQKVLEMRRRRHELTAPELDSRNRRLYAVPSHIVQREAFIGSREGFTDSYQGDPQLLGKQK